MQCARGQKVIALHIESAMYVDALLPLFMDARRIPGPLFPLYEKLRYNLLEIKSRTSPTKTQLESIDSAWLKTETLESTQRPSRTV